MDWEVLAGVGGGLVFCLLMFHEIRLFIEGRNGKSKKKNDEDTAALSIYTKCKEFLDKDVPTLVMQINKLYDWHNKMDEDNVPVWYVRRSFEDSILALNSTLEKLALILNKSMSIQERMEERLSTKLDAVLAGKNKE